MPSQRSTSKSYKVIFLEVMRCHFPRSHAMSFSSKLCEVVFLEVMRCHFPRSHAMSFSSKSCEVIFLEFIQSHFPRTYAVHQHLLCEMTRCATNCRGGCQRTYYFSPRIRDAKDDDGSLTSGNSLHLRNVNLSWRTNRKLVNVKSIILFLEHKREMRCYWAFGVKHHMTNRIIIHLNILPNIARGTANMLFLLSGDISMRDFPYESAH